MTKEENSYGKVIKLNGKQYAEEIRKYCDIHMFTMSQFYTQFVGVSANTNGNLIARNAIKSRTAEKIKSITGIDWRDYLNKPDQIQFEYAKPATTPAKDEDKADYLELIADCLTEITAELKERNKNAFHFTANETVFITRVLEDTEYVKWCLEHKVDVQRLRHESK